MHTRQRAQPTGTNRPTRTHPTQPPTHKRGETKRRHAPGEPTASTTQPRTNPPTPPPGGEPQPNTRTTPHHRPGGHSGAGKRPDPYRTRKLSPPAPMVLPPPGSGRVGHHRNTHTPTGPPPGPTTMGRPPQHRCGGRTMTRATVPAVSQQHPRCGGRNPPPQEPTDPPQKQPHHPSTAATTGTPNTSAEPGHAQPPHTTPTTQNHNPQTRQTRYRTTATTPTNPVESLDTACAADYSERDLNRIR